MYPSDLNAILPANDALVNSLRDDIKGLDPNDVAEIDVGSIMALIKRIDLYRNRELLASTATR